MYARECKKLFAICRTADKGGEHAAFSAGDTVCPVPVRGFLCSALCLDVCLPAEL
ncbi:hypothetical protein D3C74_480430 [compost metagenome]